MALDRVYRAGQPIEDFGRAWCKADWSHAAISVVDGDGRPIRVAVASAAASTTTAAGPSVREGVAVTAPAIARAVSFGDHFQMVSERERVESPMKPTTPVAPC